MGNKGSGSKAKRKAQAKRAQESGEVGPVGGHGGGGEERSAETLTITLVKLHRAVVAQAVASSEKGVRVVWHGTEYEVYWAGQWIGVVPSNFNESLDYPSPHAGRIVEISGQPHEVVVINVSVSR